MFGKESDAMFEDIHRVRVAEPPLEIPDAKGRMSVGAVLLAMRHLGEVLTEAQGDYERLRESAPAELCTRLRTLASKCELAKMKVDELIKANK